MNRNNRNKQIVISFVSFLACASMMSIMMPQKGFSATENRYLKKRPAFTVKGLLDGSFGTDYETALSDQFPARDAWIGIKVMAERAQGRRDVNGVYFGKDDYLIEKFDREDIEGEQLDRNLETVAAFVQKAEETLGKDRVRVMMVPTASQVLTDRLPFLAAPYDQSRVTERLGELLAGASGGMAAEERFEMRADKTSGLARQEEMAFLVSVEEMLAEHRQENIYYKTDHHWTVLGAYYGYRAWAESVGITPWEQEAFTIQTVSDEFLGTVSSKVNLPQKPDSIELYLPKTEQGYEVCYDGDAKPSPMYAYQALEGKDKYAVYLDGNHGLTKIYCPAAAQGDGAGRKLLLIKDSFAHSFVPFAANHFEETYMIDLRYFNLSPQTFLEEKGITDVLILYQIPGFAGEKTVSKLSW